jgi:hypothetical protein
MMAFFLWGPIPVDITIGDNKGSGDKFQSKLFQMDDSNLMKAGNDGSNSRRLARTEQCTQQHTPKKEDTKKDARDTSGATLTQEIEIAKK